MRTYRLNIEWTGNSGSGTSDYRSYERSHIISSDGKSVLECSSDPEFRGDNQKYNPEELLVAAISSCHMLWFLHLCADSGIVVTRYTDQPVGSMIEIENGAGWFKEITLHPVVTVQKKEMIEPMMDLHKLANARCFIANSVNFPVHHRVKAAVGG